MTTMTFASHTLYIFWGNVDYPTNKAALAARNALARELKANGMRTRSYTMRDQLRKYSGLGEPGGTIGNVYKLEAWSKS